MANTYTQLYIHYVFVVKHRDCLISKHWQELLYKYICGIVKEQGHKPYVINGMPDHVHLLVSMNPKQAPSDLMFNIKRSSSLWINENKLVKGQFSWQEGFGAFSLGKAQLESKIAYIEQQQEHHRMKTFKEEYLEVLKEHDVDYDERYVFKAV